MALNLRAGFVVLLSSILAVAVPVLVLEAYYLSGTGGLGTTAERVFRGASMASRHIRELSYGRAFSQVRGEKMGEREHRIQAVGNRPIYLVNAMTKTRGIPFRQARNSGSCDAAEGLLLICVISAPQNFLARDRIRKRFGRLTRVLSLGESVKLKFVIGWRNHGPGPTVQLQEEQGRHGDLLQLASVREGYSRLSAKVVAMFAAAQRFGTRFVMKMDDDVDLVNFGELVCYLQSRDIRGANMYIGRSLPLSAVPVCQQGQSRWCAPAAEYNEIKSCEQKYIQAGMQPGFMTGGCYILGRALVRQIAMGLSVQLLSLEDVHVACTLIDNPEVHLLRHDLGCSFEIQPFAAFHGENGNRHLVDQSCSKNSRKHKPWVSLFGGGKTPHRDLETTHEQTRRRNAAAKRFDDSKCSILVRAKPANVMPCRSPTSTKAQKLAATRSRYTCLSQELLSSGNRIVAGSARAKSPRNFSTAIIMSDTRSVFADGAHRLAASINKVRPQTDVDPY
jgi:hypothetical protein